MNLKNQRGIKYEDWIIVIILFILSIVIRYIIADFSKSIVVYPDELRYYSIANSLHQSGDITIHNIPSNFQKILYSIFLMPAFYFENVVVRLKVISFINCIIMSSGIFPVFLLGKQICKKRRTIYCSIILYIVMAEMCYTMTFMSEVVYYAIAVWVIYLFYQLVQLDIKNKKKISISIILGILIYVLYLNKEIALSFLVAYMGYIVILGIYERGSIKYNCRNFLLMLFSFGVIFIIAKLTIFKGLGNSYNQMGIEAILSSYNILYMLYSYFFILMMIIISFGYFPIMFPIACFNKINKKNREFLIFILGILIVSAGVIAYTISVREDLGRVGPRQHLRYIGFLFPIIWLLFLEILDRIEINVSLVKKFITITIIYVIIFASTYRGFQDGIVDHASLKYFMSFEWGNLTGGINEISFNVGRLILKLIISFVLLGESLILFKNKKLFRNTVVAIILSICLVNNVIVVANNRKNYSVSEENIMELQRLNQEFSNMEGNILVIMGKDTFDKADGEIDTYISSPSVFITYKEDIVELMKNTETYKVSEMKIHSKFPFDIYENLSTIDYVVLSKTYLIDMPEEYFEPINIEGIDNYKIFKNKIPEYLKIDNINEKQSIEYKLQDNYYSNYKIKNGEFISGKEDNFLVYGPYVELEKGIYNIEFHYEYLGDVNGEIGFVDFVANGEVLYSKAMTADENCVVIENIEVKEDIPQIETRIYAMEEGIKANRIVLNKTELIK